MQTLSSEKCRTPYLHDCIEETGVSQIYYAFHRDRCAIQGGALLNLFTTLLAKANDL